MLFVPSLGGILRGSFLMLCYFAFICEQWKAHQSFSGRKLEKLNMEEMKI